MRRWAAAGTGALAAVQTGCLRGRRGGGQRTVQMCAAGEDNGPCPCYVKRHTQGPPRNAVRPRQHRVGSRLPRSLTCGSACMPAHQCSALKGRACWKTRSRYGADHRVPHEAPRERASKRAGDAQSRRPRPGETALAKGPRWGGIRHPSFTRPAEKSWLAELGVRCRAERLLEPHHYSLQRPGSRSSPRCDRPGL